MTILHMLTHNVIISNSSPWQHHFSHTCHRTSYKPAQTLADWEFLKCHPHREKTFCCQLMLACEIQKIAQSCISLQTSIRITVYFRILAIICTQMRHFQFTHAWCSCGISWAEFRKMAEGNNALTKWYIFFFFFKITWATFSHRWFSEFSMQQHVCNRSVSGTVQGWVTSNVEHQVPLHVKNFDACQVLTNASFYLISALWVRFWIRHHERIIKEVCSKAQHSRVVWISGPSTEMILKLTLYYMFMGL